MQDNTTKIREVAVSYRGAHRKIGTPFRRPADLVGFVRGLIGREAREHFVAIFLDGRHRPIAYQIVSVGTATASLVHPREVFQPAVGIGACAVIVAHNHPSGDPKPSREDRDVTQRLVNAGHCLGIQLLDSVVIGATGYFAFKEEEPAIFEPPAI